MTPARFASFVLTAFLAASPGAAAQDCAGEWAAFADAVKSNDAAAIAAAAAAPRRNSYCSGEERQDIARRGALATARLAENLPPAAQMAALHGAVQLSAGSPPWQVLARLGRLAYNNKEYDQAQAAFELALNDIDDPSVNPEPPSVEVITRIHALAGQARMLSPRPRSPPLTQGGAPGGLALENIRSLKVSRAPVPVRFNYDEATFSKEGEEDAAFLRAYLAMSGGPQAVTLVGHTDLHGPAGREDAYNCRLSQRRVEALKKHLIDNGYPADRIKIVAMGLRQPRPIIETEIKLTAEERDRLLRRVEFFKADEKPEIANACAKS